MPDQCFSLSHDPAGQLSVLANHHFDSRRWEHIRFRSGDIVISSWAKSGTTWLQQLTCQLVHGGPSGLNVSEISPWVDFRIAPLEEVVARLEAQRHRRVMKSHLPADAIPLAHEVQYLYIVREPLDVVWSWYCHHRNFTDDTYHRLNSAPDRVGPALERPDPVFKRYFRRWIEEDGYPFHPYWSNIASWWSCRHLPNVRLVHFADLRRAFESELRRIADFLRIQPSLAAWSRIVRHCSLPHMKANAHLVAPLGGAIFKGGAESFIRTGDTKQWAGLLDDSDERACREAAELNLPRECVDWLFAEPALNYDNIFRRTDIESRSCQTPSRL
jgi:aryl sulfotransferase